MANGSTHREEALKALDSLVEKLDGAEPLEGITRHILKATAEYCREQVVEIQEVQRVRRKKEAVS